MAIRFLDGFDHYRFADVLKKWTSMATGYQWDQYADIGPAYARPGSGQQGFRAYNVNLRKTLSAAQATLTIGHAYFWNVTPTNQTLIQFLDSGLNEQCSLRTDGSARPTFTRNGTVLATASSPLVMNTWYYLEVKATIHNTTGAYEVRVDGTAVIGPTTGANTRGQSENSATTFVICGGDNIRCVDDLYCTDANGGVNTGFLGPIRVVALSPDAAGALAAWTPTGYADNFDNVNELQADGDVTFNESGSAGDIDTFGHVGIPAGSILGIQHNLWARREAGVARSIRPIQRSGATNYAGTTVAIGESYQDYLDCDDVDPATGSAYTQTNLNAAEFGYELVS